MKGKILVLKILYSAGVKQFFLIPKFTSLWVKIEFSRKKKAKNQENKRKIAKISQSQTEKNRSFSTKGKFLREKVKIKRTSPTNPGNSFIRVTKCQPVPTSSSSGIEDESTLLQASICWYIQANATLMVHIFFSLVAFNLQSSFSLLKDLSQVLLFA